MKKRILLVLFIVIIGLIIFNIKKYNKYIKYSEDIYLAVTVDGENQSSIPAKGNYTVKAICPNAIAKWDYDNWELNITNIGGLTKCMLVFNSTTPVNLAEYIMSLTNADGVYNEPATDYRYEGENPNNYLSFNNELWRIIGVFSDNTHGKTGEKLVKIIRNDSLGALAWDKSDTNNWAASSLYNLLNQYYYNGTNEPTLTNCYQYSTTIKGKCDFIINGITNNYYRNMIENVTWHLGGIASMSDVGTVYAAERGTTRYSGRPTDTTGYIGLMYPSDYGYSALSSTCVRSTSLGSYNSAACGGSAWLRGEGYEWTLMPHSSYSSNVCYVYYYGIVNNDNANNGFVARPVLYLISDTQKLTGTGTSDNPYIIKAN